MSTRTRSLVLVCGLVILFVGIVILPALYQMFGDTFAVGKYLALH